MDCCPIRGGTEDWVIEPFIGFLNRTEGRNYRYVRALDKTSRNRPEPEALYADEKGKLAVEHKTVVWPKNYSQWHASDHSVADAIGTEIAPLITGQASYQLVLPHTIRGTSDELRAFAARAGSRIKERWPDIEAGKAIGLNDGPRWWRLRRLHSSELEEDEKPGGLRIRWMVGEVEWEPSQEAIEDIREEVTQHLSKCVKKFTEYVDARKIVVLQLVTAISFFDRAEWERVMQGIRAPEAIGEIWFADRGWVTDYEQAWEYTRLHPAPIKKWGIRDEEGE